MTQKEFLTNLVRDLGYQVVSYKSLLKRVEIELDTCQKLSIEWGRNRRSPKLVTLKVICLPLPFVGDYPLTYCTRAREIVNKANAFLRERKLEGVADWYSSPYKDRQYLRIRSIDPVWYQAQKHVPDSEILGNPQYKVCGDVLEDSQE